MLDSIEKKEKKRDISIDILKVFAVFFVMNSHMHICYPKYGFLATGGAIGDALFFFSSGFTLLLGKQMRFDNWYKRRIIRIYPSVIACSIITCLFYGISESIVDILLGKRYWFIGCIMIYYILLFPIKYFGNGKYLDIVFILSSVFIYIIYFLFFNNGDSLYGGGLYRCFVFFLFMLLGAKIGIMKKEKYSHWHILFLFLSIFVFYTINYVWTKNWLMILSIFPLMGICYYLYLVCNAPWFLNIIKYKSFSYLISFISQLCLETYLIQKYIFTDSLNFMFPINIPIIMFVTLFVAYLLRIISEFLRQTFDSKPYVWKKLFLYNLYF